MSLGLEYAEIIERNAEVSPQELRELSGFVTSVKGPLEQCREKGLLPQRIDTTIRELENGSIRNLRELEIMSITCPEVRITPRAKLANLMTITSGLIYLVICTGFFESTLPYNAT